MSVFSNRVDRSMGVTIEPILSSGADPDCTHRVANDLINITILTITLFSEKILALADVQFKSAYLILL